MGVGGFRTQVGFAARRRSRQTASGPGPRGPARSRRRAADQPQHAVGHRVLHGGDVEVRGVAAPQDHRLDEPEDQRAAVVGTVAGSRHQLAVRGPQPLAQRVELSNCSPATSGRTYSTPRFRSPGAEQPDVGVTSAQRRAAAGSAPRARASAQTRARADRVEQQPLEDRVLAAEAVVDRRLAHARGVGDRAGARRRVAHRAEEARGRVEHVATGVALTVGVAARARSTGAAMASRRYHRPRDPPIPQTRRVGSPLRPTGPAASRSARSERPPGTHRRCNRRFTSP